MLSLLMPVTLAAVATLCAAAPAEAVVITQGYAFSATTNGPIAEHRGWIELALDLDTLSYSLTDIRFRLAETRFTAATAAASFFGLEDVIVGGTVLNDLRSITNANITGVSDFLFIFNPLTLETFGFTYTTPSPDRDPFYFGTLSVRPAAGIPEPTAWALLLTGFGLVGLVRRTARATA